MGSHNHKEWPFPGPIKNIRQFWICTVVIIVYNIIIMLNRHNSFERARRLLGLHRAEHPRQCAGRILSRLVDRAERRLKARIPWLKKRFYQLDRPMTMSDLSEEERTVIAALYLVAETEEERSILKFLTPALIPIKDIDDAGFRDDKKDSACL